MTVTDLIGWIAALLVLATFSARDMVPLRTMAIASNVAFVIYGYRAELWPILMLHLMMLPVNAVRLHQQITAVRQTARGRHEIAGEDRCKVLKAWELPARRPSSWANTKAAAGLISFHRSDDLAEARNVSIDVDTMTGTAAWVLFRVPAKLTDIIFGLFRPWLARQQERRQLAQMSRRDFGDIFVPPGLIKEEVRRWPWQPVSQGWDAIRRYRRDERCNAKPLALDDAAT